jgi:hypothetical protein
MKEPEKEEMWTPLFEVALILEDLKVLSKYTNAHKASAVTTIDPNSLGGTKLINAFENLQYQIPFIPSLNTVLCISNPYKTNPSEICSLREH